MYLLNSVAFTCALLVVVAGLKTVAHDSYVYLCIGGGWDGALIYYVGRWALLIKGCSFFLWQLHPGLASLLPVGFSFFLLVELMTCILFIQLYIHVHVNILYMCIYIIHVYISYMCKYYTCIYIIQLFNFYAPDL